MFRGQWDRDSGAVGCGVSHGILLFFEAGSALLIFMLMFMEQSPTKLVPTAPRFTLRLHRADCSSNSIILPTGCEWVAMVETILSALAPIVFTLLLGFVAAWRHDFGPKEASVLNRMVLLYAVPLALFVGTVGTPRTDLVQDIAFVVAIFVAIVGFYVLVFVLFIFIFRFSLSESVLAALAASSPAVPFLGPAILGDLFGKTSAVTIAIASLVINLIVVPVTILGLALGRTPVAITGSATTRHSAFTEKLLETVKQPIVWAPVLAFVLVLCNVRVPSIVDHGLSLLGQATSGVALFASGIMLAAYKIQIDRTALSLALLKNIVQPALVLVGLRSLGYGAPIVPEAVLTTAIPSMPIVIVLAVQYHVLEGRASSALFLSVIGSMFTIGVFIALTQ
ncbi:MAG: AEC family transporter [Xanthobacteraceae bacterium]